MTGFLVNLARRGAGLPVTSIQTPQPSPFGPEISKHVENVTETPGTVHNFPMGDKHTIENIAPEAPGRTSSAEEGVEYSPEVPTHHTPAIQRLSELEPSTLNQPSVIESAATIRTPLVESSPVPRSYMLSDAGEAQATPLEPPNHLESAILSLPSAREDIAEIEVEGDRHAPSSIGHDIEVSSRPPSPSSSLVSAAAMVVQEPGEQRNAMLPELSSERARIGAQPIPETSLPVATIRAALTESSAVLDLPRIPASSPPTSSAPLPIHVRIGRVEVRATTASPPTPAVPSSSGPVGFDAYYRRRNYRS
jgi:hypothetical protein